MYQQAKQPPPLPIMPRRKEWRCRSAKVGNMGKNTGELDTNSSQPESSGLLRSFAMRMMLNTVHETDDSRYYYSSLMDLAGQKLKEKKLAEAKSIYYQALTLARHHCRASFMATRSGDNMDYEDTLDLANTLQDMGNVCYEMGDYSEARSKLAEALDLKRQYYRELECLNHRLPLFNDWNKGKSVTKRSNSTGGFITRTASNLQEIAEQGRKNLHGESGVVSEPSSPVGNFGGMESANVHYSDNCGRKNLDLAAVLEDLGRVNKKLQDYTSAVRYYHEALDLKRLFYGKLSRMHINAQGQLNLKQQAYGYDVAQNVDIANLHLRLAELAHLQGKYHSARKRYGTALEMFQKAYGGRHHTDTATVLLHLSQVNSDMNRPSHAKKFLDLAVSCIEELKKSSGEVIVNGILTTSLHRSFIVSNRTSSRMNGRPLLQEIQTFLQFLPRSDI